MDVTHQSSLGTELRKFGFMKSLHLTLECCLIFPSPQAKTLRK